jgi:hypothetical protein
MLKFSLNWVGSSLVERFSDKEEADGSIPSRPTKAILLSSQESFPNCIYQKINLKGIFVMEPLG